MAVIKKFENCMDTDVEMQLTFPFPHRPVVLQLQDIRENLIFCARKSPYVPSKSAAVRREFA